MQFSCSPFLCSFRVLRFCVSCSSMLCCFRVLRFCVVFVFFDVVSFPSYPCCVVFVLSVLCCFLVIRVCVVFVF